MACDIDHQAAAAVLAVRLYHIEEMSQDKENEQVSATRLLSPSNAVQLI